jgi:hypothetical protein
VKSFLRRGVFFEWDGMIVSMDSFSAFAMDSFCAFEQLVHQEWS